MSTYHCRVAQLGVQRRAHADEAEPKLPAVTEGLAAGEPQAIPLLSRCQHQEICCGIVGGHRATRAAPRNLSARPLGEDGFNFTFFKHADAAAVDVQLGVGRCHQRDAGHQGEVGAVKRPRRATHLDLQEGAAPVP